MTARHRAVAAAFNRAAAGYDSHAALQRVAARQLAECVAGLDLPRVPRILEIGCGTGLLTGLLHARLPEAAIVATDLAPAMAQACRARLGPDIAVAVMDGATPCFAGSPFDLICASLAFQWFDDLPASLAHLHSLLASNGYLAFTSLGPETFSAWREAHRREHLPPPAAYLDPAVLVSGWPGAVSITRIPLVMAHPDGLDFLRTLRGLGAHLPPPGHAPLAAGALRRVVARFEADFSARADYDLVLAVLARAAP